MNIFGFEAVDALLVFHVNVSLFKYKNESNNPQIQPVVHSVFPTLKSSNAFKYTDID